MAWLGRTERLAAMLTDSTLEARGVATYMFRLPSSAKVSRTLVLQPVLAAASWSSYFSCAAYAPAMSFQVEPRVGTDVSPIGTLRVRCPEHTDESIALRATNVGKVLAAMAAASASIGRVMPPSLKPAESPGIRGLCSSTSPTHILAIAAGYALGHDADIDATQRIGTTGFQATTAAGDRIVLLTERNRITVTWSRTVPRISTTRIGHYHQAAVFKAGEWTFGDCTDPAATVDHVAAAVCMVAATAAP